MKTKVVTKIIRAVSLTSIVIILAMSVVAQSNTGSITGVVTDPNGAVVPNATVTVTNQGTNEARTVQTDGEGRYEVPSLSTGIYTVEASGSGFTATSVKDLRLAVGERARADIAMTAGGVSAVVEVVDQTRTDTETSTIGDNITAERIQDNPVKAAISLSCSRRFPAPYNRRINFKPASTESLRPSVVPACSSMALTRAASISTARRTCSAGSSPA